VWSHFSRVQCFDAVGGLEQGAFNKIQIDFTYRVVKRVCVWSPKFSSASSAHAEKAIFLLSHRLHIQFCGCVTLWKIIVRAAAVAEASWLVLEALDFMRHIYNGSRALFYFIHVKSEKAALAQATEIDPFSSFKIIAVEDNCRRHPVWPSDIITVAAINSVHQTGCSRRIPT